MRVAVQQGKTDTDADALLVRRAILECLFRSGGGHYGGALSVADILLVLGKEVVQLDAYSIDRRDRDRLILSKGHAAAALYAVLQRLGLLKGADLAHYGHLDAGLEGHPDMSQTEGVDFSTGSLGQGLSAGIGMAFVLGPLGSHIWVVLGDGECQEGQVWEAAMLAARYKLGNLHVVVDVNGAQEIGWRHDPALVQEPTPGLREKWMSFDWAVHEVDGHDRRALAAVFRTARSHASGPTAILARTTKGKGVRIIEENPVRYHCTALSEAEHREVLESIYA